MCIFVIFSMYCIQILNPVEVTNIHPQAPILGLFLFLITISALYLHSFNIIFKISENLYINYTCV